jgi:hypothetical protein
MLDQYCGVNKTKSKPTGNLPVGFALTIAALRLIGLGPVTDLSLVLMRLAMERVVRVSVYPTTHSLIPHT